MSDGSIMPPYAFMLEKNLDTSTTPAKIRAMQKLGVPYPSGFDSRANRVLMEQASSISSSLLADSIRIAPQKEVIALIAYMQRLGSDINHNKPQ